MYNNYMKISILTLFPDMFSGPFDYSIVKRAKEKKLIDISLINIRDFATDNYKTVDDKPYGGGKGMIMKVDVLHRAIESVFNRKVKSSKSKVKSAIPACADRQNSKVILLDPKGTTFTQEKAKEYSRRNHLILICGHYEGIDARVKHFVDESISIGDYVLTGGEIPAMVIVDSVIRLVTGVLDKAATEDESFTKKDVLEYPQYTRPQEYKKHKVPDVLLFGNHKEIEKWRKTHSHSVNGSSGAIVDSGEGSTPGVKKSIR